MSIVKDEAVFYSWDDACKQVGDEKVLREIEEIYFHFSGFASVEVEERSFERVYVDGYIRLYQADVNELKRGMPVTCSSALIDRHLVINGEVREDLLQKFLVFDDELLVGADMGQGENEYNYPKSLCFHRSDIRRIYDLYGIHTGLGEEETAKPRPSPDGEGDMLNVIGALACMLAMNNDLESSLQDGQHISEIIIDDLFTMMSGLGVSIDGKNKFHYERLISDGVKSILEQ
ncbi:MAG: hypothetical protein KZQ99_03105 [Candidatus Thiodiazotropha sp. (ex Dulcina madagascariensis)]|nr:hypothetical protein [Candidatus Thiodiazotropha sp. (ex Epidulcina cf. delphinae)]MCU7933852.1 hypothetical protein [Candidatus Thiodiazotropha sp. (ex Dulcina madagascariensis)]